MDGTIFPVSSCFLLAAFKRLTTKALNTVVGRLRAWRVTLGRSRCAAAGSGGAVALILRGGGQWTAGGPSLPPITFPFSFPRGRCHVSQQNKNTTRAFAGYFAPFAFECVSFSSWRLYSIQAPYGACEMGAPGVFLSARARALCADDHGEVSPGSVLSVGFERFVRRPRGVIRERKLRVGV